MLSTVRDILGARLSAGETSFGRIRDVYFDDHSWQIRYLVAVAGVQRSLDHLRLVTPDRLRFGSGADHRVEVHLTADEMAACPSADEVKPVCRQYESLSYGSPQARTSILPRNADPHLRSWNTVSSYAVEYGGETVGRLHNFVFDRRTSSIRYLQIAEEIDGKIVHFQLLPAAVDRISWAAQRISLRYLQPVQLGIVLGAAAESEPSVAAAAA